jgi:RHS repeat-associated protein
VQWDWLWLDNLPVLQFEDSYDGAGTLIGTTATYLHPDHLGTPRIGTDTAGAIVWRYRSDGFGTLTNANSREVRLRLPGQIALGLGAINYNYFRDYDPNIGRYLESDPIGLDGGLNSYGYVEQNPLRHVDPHGLATWTCLASNTGGIGAYSNGMKMCRYTCTADCEKTVNVDAPGWEGSFGAYHCYGVKTTIQTNLGGTLSDSPLGPPRAFSVITDGLAGVFNRLWYPSQLWEELKRNEDGSTCCQQ